MHVFAPFSLTHLVTVLVCAAVGAVLTVLGVRWRGTERGTLLHRAWAWAVTLVQAFNLIFWLTPPRLDPADSLPLHICDIAGIVAAVSMWTDARWARAVMVYWGIGLSTQGFIFPVIRDGPDTVRFHIFFLSHLTIVATAVYDTVARGFRLGWRDLRTITLILAGWTLVVLPIDIAMRWNYGYIGDVAGKNPAVMLGPWPLRLLWMFLLAEGAFALLTWGSSRLPKPAGIPNTE